MSLLYHVNMYLEFLILACTMYYLYSSISVDDFDRLVESIEELPTLYSVDIVNMDTCKNELLLEDIREYGRKI